MVELHVTIGALLQYAKGVAQVPKSLGKLKIGFLAKKVPVI